MALIRRISIVFHFYCSKRFVLKLNVFIYFYHDNIVIWLVARLCCFLRLFSVTSKPRLFKRLVAIKTSVRSSFMSLVVFLYICCLTTNRRFKFVGTAGYQNKGTVSKFGPIKEYDRLKGLGFRSLPTPCDLRKCIRTKYQYVRD